MLASCTHSLHIVLQNENKELRIDILWVWPGFYKNKEYLLGMIFEMSKFHLLYLKP